VLVVDHGRIVEDGPHRELVRSGGYYAALYRQWTSGRDSHHGQQPDLQPFTA
jgi:ABC-type transport system involved in cytochrome bd biosynthesis fused ATPase/permease subunit